ncbi:MAG: hypothetical protein OEU92_14760 [Alphaproteobacteria bacterium]|nr:hypothetical protein [Alphaproteobacteria bacterium]
MAIDVSEAIALAKDLLKTSGDFHPHDPVLAERFSHRAYEICDDLGIDRDLIGERVVEPIEDADNDDGNSAIVETPPASPRAISDDEEARQTSQQLSDLLEQQANVLKNARETEAVLKPAKGKKRSFRLFGRSAVPGIGALQSA